MENTAITMGRLALASPQKVAPHIGDIVRIWSQAMMHVSAGAEQDSALRGMCEAAKYNPNGVLEGGEFLLRALAASQNPSDELRAVSSPVSGYPRIRLAGCNLTILLLLGHPSLARMKSEALPVKVQFSLVSVATSLSSANVVSEIVLLHSIDFLTSDTQNRSSLFNNRVTKHFCILNRVAGSCDLHSMHLLPCYKVCSFSFVTLSRKLSIVAWRCPAISAPFLVRIMSFSFSSLS